MDVRDLTRKLATEKDFVYLKRQIAPDVAQRVAAMSLPGIHEQKEYRRYYPGGDVMAHMLGFTGVDDKGQEGIELAFENQLAGKPGSRRVIKDRRGQIVEDVESIRAPQDGKDVAAGARCEDPVSRLRQPASEALETHRAKAGGMVVLDARSGEILALANLPTYNPNNRIQAGLARSCATGR
jgi:cell division protein FtsI (penicillin-binding protein 3)